MRGWGNYFLYLLVVAAVAGMVYYLAIVRRGAVDNQEKPPVVPTIGEIQILNGCGENGAAQEIKAYLQKQGFNVVECGNAESFKHEETIVCSRRDDMTIARQVAQALKTDNVLSYINNKELFDVSVIVSHDYKKLIAQ